MSDLSQELLTLLDSVDDATPLGMCHLPYIMLAMQRVSAHWKNVGLNLGLDVADLDRIGQENKRSTDKCLTAVIAEWLKNHSPDCPPTWRKVCFTVAERIGGDNPSEARRIANEHNSGMIATVSEERGVDPTWLGPDSTAKVIGAIERGVTPRWMEMGLLLGLDYRKLDAIRADDALDGVSERAAAMVKVWFKQKQDTDHFGYPSWKRLVEVIGSPAGGKDKALARMIAAEHPRPPVPPPQAMNPPSPLSLSAEPSAEPSDLSLSPVSPSTSLGSPLSSVADAELGVNDLLDVSEYLLNLSDKEICDLGLSLGLQNMTLNSVRRSDTPLDTMLTAWLMGKDNVGRRGGHSWRSLARALRSERIGQSEIADDIKLEHCC